MSNFYPYLVSSLPALIFGMKAPLSFDSFLERLDALIPGKDIETLTGLKYLSFDICAVTENAALKKWLSFDTMIRNELVRLRAARKKADPAKYLRANCRPESSYSAHIAVNAYRRPGMLEAEKALDLERWRALDEFQTLHYFDLDSLIIYGIKLRILEKWDKVTSSDAEKMLEGVLSGPLKDKR